MVHSLPKTAEEKKYTLNKLSLSEIQSLYEFSKLILAEIFTLSRIFSQKFFDLDFTTSYNFFQILKNYNIFNILI
jgi:hypothetical protein